MAYETMTVGDLRAEVRAQGLRTTAVGSAAKADLIAALRHGTPLPVAGASGMQASLLGSTSPAPKQAPPVASSSGADALIASIAAQVQAAMGDQLDHEAIAQIAQGAVMGSMVDAAAELERGVDSKIAAASMPLVIEIHDVKTAETKNLGLQHASFPALLTMCQARDKDGHHLNPYLYGPAGTGKTTAAANVAKSLGLAFHFNGCIDSEYKLSGFIDAGGVFRSRPFREAYEHGGVYLFDELDDSMPSAVNAFNAALANGHADFPDRRVDRHADNIIIGAGNTTLRGDGHTDGHNRQEQDSALIDRFCYLAWPIDEALESATVPAKHAEWLATVREVRTNVAKHGVKKSDVTPRAAYKGMALLDAGLSRDQVIDSVLRRGLPSATWDQIKPAKKES